MKHLSEEQLALYAWGDSEPQENRAIADHLQSCGQCRKLLCEFEEAQQFITAALQNPAASELSEVRTRFTARLQPQQSSASSWAWWSAGAAAALALLLLPHMAERRPSMTQTVEPPILVEPLSPGPTLQIPLVPAATSRPKHLRSSKAGIRSVTLISQTDREPIIEMTTADPNVIILWQTNEKRELKP